MLTMAAVGLIGGGLALDRSTVDPLRMPSISRLGIDPRAGVILNATLIGLGLCLLALGMCVRSAFAAARGDAPIMRSARELIAAGFVVAGVALVLTGAFPIDEPTSTVVHNLAGFTTPIVLMASLLGARKALGSLGHSFDVLAVIAVAGNASLFALASAVHVVPYPIMELVCFALIGVWLWVFEASLRRSRIGGDVQP